jgi:aminopeptidase N
MKIAAPGTVTRDDAGDWRFVHANAREYAASLSPYFNVYAQTADNGVEVELYAFGENNVVHDGTTVSGSAQALDAAARSLAMYSDLFGDYPVSRFVVVQGDFPDGTEFSDLVFVSDDWFRTNPGTPESYLTIITVHEVSHQWWYARVGNDQATTPWLDEALATYSEYIFFEEHYPDLRDWWWNFRVDSFVGDYNGKRVDSTVYEFATVREYINAVYLRGAHMLHDLREDLGTEVFFDWLSRYAEAGENRVVTPDLFWSLLTPEQMDLTRQTRVEYLRLSE